MDHSAFDAGIPAFGTGVLYAFLVAAAFTFAVSIAAATSLKGVSARLLRAARLGALGTCGLVGLDVMVLLYAFISHDFRIRYVAHYSDRSMSTTYLIAALWGGQDGSLLWWTFLLSLYTAACVMWLRGRYKELAPWIIATLMGVLIFFGVLMAYAANPFAATFGGAPADGEGLNPSLQNFYMAIHPPSLYTGFVGCTVPFAFTVAALVTGRLDEEWIIAVRRWVLFAWLFLSIGNVLGMLWAYEELGWGGFWAWDPVENAACLPWWTTTAFLHSVMIQERRGILKVWNVSLLLTTFFLTIFGTFLTRSGLISSIHSFAQSGIGTYFVVFMAMLVVFSVVLVVWRLPLLRRPASIDSVLSREAMFVANNWMLLGICVFIALATVWPKVSEWLWDERLTVGASFYNAWLSPIGLVLFSLVGIGTLTPWRKASPELLIKAFRGPVAAGITAVVLHLVFGRALRLPPFVHVDPIYDQVTALRLGTFVFGHINVGRAVAWLDGHLPPVAVGIFAFNVSALVQEFWRGTEVRMRSKNESAPVALSRLVSKNRRRYGGYIVHLGFALMTMGWLGSAWRQDVEGSVAVGQSLSVGRYVVRYDGSEMRRDPNKRMVFAHLTAFRDGKLYAHPTPARFIYTTHPENPTTEVSITSSLREDLYVVMASVNPETHVAHIKVFVNPLTVWIWIGAMILILGLVTSMWPDVSLGLARDRAEAKSRGVGAIARGVALLLLSAGVALMPTELRAQPMQHTNGPPPVGLVQSYSPQERVLFEGLRCMCGGCERLPLATCTCDFAEHQRALLRARMAAGESTASIVNEYVERFGPSSLAVPPDRGHNKALYVLPVVALAAGAVLGVRLARRWARRGQDAAAKSLNTTDAPETQGAAHRTSAAGVTPASNPTDGYDARIDEELRGLDDE